MYDRRIEADESEFDGAVAALREARQAWRTTRHWVSDVDRFPSGRAVAQIVTDLSAALYPRRLGRFAGPDTSEDAFVAASLASALAALEREVAHELAYWEDEATATFEPDQPRAIVRLFADTLGDARRLIDSDVEAAFLGDPAARSVDEILVCYPGAIASLHHRIAHSLYELGAPIVARLISELANERTGIDIHPGATIGESFFIDHGTGVVIGETSVVGARVRLYQHVTLGACSPLGEAHAPQRDRYARHPRIEDDVVVYAGTTILGPVTIGAGATIGGNVWLLSDVPAGSVVVQPQAVVVDRHADHDLRSALARPDR